MAEELLVKDAPALSWPDVADREAMLVHRCVAGEESACSELVADNQRMVFQLAFHLLGDYEEALRYGEAGYTAFADVNHRWGMIGAACRVGFAFAALGEPDRARERLRWALGQARATEATSLALLALSGVGVLLARQGEERSAAELLTFVLGYPGFPPFYFITSRPELERLEAELPPAELAAAREGAGEADFEAVVAAAEDVLGGALAS